MKKSFRKLGMATAMVLTMVGFAACGDDDEATRMGGEEDETTTENKGESENYIQTKGEFLGEFVPYKREKVEEQAGKKKIEEDTDLSWGNKVSVMKLSGNRYLYAIRSSLSKDDYTVDYLYDDAYMIYTENLVIGKEYYTMEKINCDVNINDIDEVNNWIEMNNWVGSFVESEYIKLTSESTFETHSVQISRVTIDSQYNPHTFEHEYKYEIRTTDYISYYKRIDKE